VMRNLCLFLVYCLTFTLVPLSVQAEVGYRYLLEDLDDEGFVYDVARPARRVLVSVLVWTECAS
jgi:hypothetical protein